MKRSQIKPYKETECIDCNDGQIRKTVARRCIESPYHYNKHKQAIQRERQKLKPVKKYVIPQVNKKKTKELAEYRKVRDQFFKENPVCQFPGCNSREIQLHHKKGRVGNLLSDKRYFSSLCDKHHRYVELNPIEAKKLGLSLDRLT